MARVVVSGYLVRNPLGGYAWQAAHYLLGVRALGHEVWFYEDTSLYAQAYNPVTNEYAPVYEHGLAATARFLTRLGLGDRWMFVDVARGRAHGPGAGRVSTLLRDADVVLNIAGISRVAAEQRDGRPSVYVDIDPAFTQIRAAAGDRLLRTILPEHVAWFTYGTNIGTPRSPVPDGGFPWRPTLPPVALEHWQGAREASRTYTTVGRWNETQRDVTFGGRVLRWSKRAEWMHCLDLPARTGTRFELAMDVENAPGDTELLRRHGWRIRDPRDVSADPWRYRDYVAGSRGEFTVAKELNVRLRSGWFSDRAACYLAAGRPVVLQDTGFTDTLPLGPGLHVFHSVTEAADAIVAIEADYARASAHARALAQEHLEAARVVRPLLAAAGV